MLPLFELPTELVVHILQRVDEFSLGSFAQASTAACLLVRAHRHGVILPLCSRCPSQRDFLHAFGMKLGEIAPLYSAPRVKQARIYDLRICLALALKVKGGWAGVKAAQQTHMAAVEKKRKREEAAGAELMLRKERVATVLRKMQIARNVDDFRKKLQRHDHTLPLAVDSFLTHGSNFESAAIEMARAAVVLQRHRELVSVLGALNLRVPWTHWSAEMRDYVEHGEGDAQNLMRCIRAS